MQNNGTEAAEEGAKMFAVLYAAKSTSDPRDSIGTQVSDCKAMAQREGMTVIGEPHIDRGFSAFTGNRGPGLADAEAELANAAERYGRDKVVCLVQHSDRITRGAGDRPDAPQHLVEFVLRFGKLGVTLRSVQDDLFGDPRTAVIMAAMQGGRNHEDSLRKSASIRDGKDRSLARGDRLGGPIPDGYRLARIEPRDGREVRVYEIDPEREPVIRRLLGLALEGKSWLTISRTLNREGWRTAKRTIKTKDSPRFGRAAGGRPFTPRRVEQSAFNPFYAGLISRGWDNADRDPETVQGHHPAFITPAEHDRIRELRPTARRRRGLNGRSGERRTKQGAPTRSFLIDGGEGGMGGCLRCRGLIKTKMSTYPRRDGSRKRSYFCDEHWAGGDCDLPEINAEIVDAALITALDGLFVDFDAWVDAQASRSASGRSALEADLERERSIATGAAKKQRLFSDRYETHVSAGEDALAAADADQMGKQAQRRDHAEGRIKNLQALLAEEDKTPDQVDEALDWFNGLQGAIRGGLKHPQLGEVNTALRETFARFWMDVTESGEVKVVPELHADIRGVIVSGANGETRLIPGAVYADILELGEAPDPTMLKALSEAALPPPGTSLEPWLKDLPSPMPVLIDPEDKSPQLGQL